MKCCLGKYLLGEWNCTKEMSTILIHDDCLKDNTR